MTSYQRIRTIYIKYMAHAHLRDELQIEYIDFIEYRATLSI